MKKLMYKFTNQDSGILVSEYNAQTCYDFREENSESGSIVVTACKKIKFAEIVAASKDEDTYLSDKYRIVLGRIDDDGAPEEEDLNDEERNNILICDCCCKMFPDEAITVYFPGWWY